MEDNENNELARIRAKAKLAYEQFCRYCEHKLKVANLWLFLFSAILVLHIGVSVFILIFVDINLNLTGEEITSLSDLEKLSNIFINPLTYVISVLFVHVPFSIFFNRANSNRIKTTYDKGKTLYNDYFNEMPDFVLESLESLKREINELSYALVSFLSSIKAILSK